MLPVQTLRSEVASQSARVAGDRGLTARQNTIRYLGWREQHFNGTRLDNTDVCPDTCCAGTICSAVGQQLYSSPAANRSVNRARGSERSTQIFSADAQKRGRIAVSPCCRRGGVHCNAVNTIRIQWREQYSTVNMSGTDVCLIPALVATFALARSAAVAAAEQQPIHQVPGAVKTECHRRCCQCRRSEARSHRKQPVVQARGSMHARIQHQTLCGWEVAGYQWHLTSTSDR
jgi:hypothetical protein